MVNKYMKRCSVSLAIRERQIKTTIRYNSTHTVMALIKRTVVSVDENVGKLEASYTVDKTAK